MSNGVSQAVARPARTLGQLAPVAVLPEFIDSCLHDLTDR